MQWLRRITESPHLNVAVGVLLILISGDETIEALSDGFTAADINSHLGVSLMGLFNMLKALPDLFEGLEYLQRTEG